MSNLKVTKNNKLLIYSGMGIVIVGLLIGSYFMFFYSSYKFTEDRPIRILMINSYHPEHGWAQSQFASFEEYLPRS